MYHFMMAVMHDSRQNCPILGKWVAAIFIMELSWRRVGCMRGAKWVSREVMF